MKFTFLGHEIDEGIPEDVMANIANATALDTGFVRMLGVSWQGLDEDEDPTKAVQVDGKWYVIYHSGGQWHARSQGGWEQSDFEWYSHWSRYPDPADDASPSTVAEFEGGGIRSSDDGKPDFTLLMVTDLCYDDQVLTRGAKRMAEGAKAYGRLNHEKMSDPDALTRCKASLLRHTMQYLTGETDEDHLAAIQCNIVMISGIEKRVKDG